MLILASRGDVRYYVTHEVEDGEGSRGTLTRIANVRFVSCELPVVRCGAARMFGRFSGKAGSVLFWLRSSVGFLCIHPCAPVYYLS